MVFVEVASGGVGVVVDGSPVGAAVVGAAVVFETDDVRLLFVSLL